MNTINRTIRKTARSRCFFNKKKIIGILLCFLFWGNADSNKTPEKTTDLTLSKLSIAAAHLFRKIKTVDTDIKKYQNNEVAINYFSYQKLVVGSQRTLLFAQDLSYNTLFFTKLGFTPQDELEELRFFYYDEYSRLKQDYLEVARKIVKLKGSPKSTQEIGRRMERIWYWNDCKMVLILNEEQVSRRGVIQFSVFKVPNNQNKVIAASKPPKATTPPKPPKADPPDFPNNSNEKETIPAPEELTEKGVPKKNTKPSLESYGDDALFTVSKTTSLRADAMDDGQIIARIKPNELFQVLDSESSFYWTWVYYKDYMGWVKTALIVEPK